MVRVKRGLYGNMIIRSYDVCRRLHTFHHCSTFRTSCSNAIRSALMLPCLFLKGKERRASEKSGKIVNKFEFFCRQGRGETGRYSVIGAMSGLYSEWNADLGFGGAEEAEYRSIACDSFFPFPAFPGKRTFPIRQLDLPGSPPMAFHRIHAQHRSFTSFLVPSSCFHRSRNTQFLALIRRNT